MIKLELERYEAQKTLYIADRKIRDTSAVNIVIGDSNCKYLEFNMPRFYDGIDLSRKTIQIHYLRSDLKGNVNVPINVDIKENDIVFGWIVPPEAASKPGKLLVAIEAFGKDYVWRTTPAVFLVENSLHPGEGIPEPDNNWYEQFLEEMDKRTKEVIEARGNNDSLNKRLNNFDISIEKSIEIIDIIESEIIKARADKEDLNSRLEKIEYDIENIDVNAGERKEMVKFFDQSWKNISVEYLHLSKSYPDANGKIGTITTYKEVEK